MKNLLTKKPLSEKVAEAIAKIEGYEGYYEVTSSGKVFSCSRKELKRNKWGSTTLFIRKRRELKPYYNKLGYASVILCRDKVTRCFLVHRLVATHFIKNPFNKTVVNHKDFNPSNNDYRNLEWCTTSENNQYTHTNHRFPSQKGELHPSSKLKNEDILVIRDLYESGKYTQRDLAKKFNVYKNHIWKIIKGKSWGHIS